MKQLSAIHQRELLAHHLEAVAEILRSHADITPFITVAGEAIVDDQLANGEFETFDNVEALMDFFDETSA